MSRELIYTSAPRGLVANTKGFCTVAVTAGMSKQVRLTLESLCGYEFKFNISDPKAHLNPVNYTRRRGLGWRPGTGAPRETRRAGFCHLQTRAGDPPAV